MKILISAVIFTAISLVMVLVAFNVLAQEEDQPRINAANKRWIVYYGSALPSSTFDDYDIIVFDRDKHPPIQNLKAKGKTVLGYISAGQSDTCFT